MKKWVFLAGVAVGVAAVVAAQRPSGAGGGRAMMWERMRRRMEEMPEDFPPRVMFDNVAATRANSERILELLGTESSAGKQGG